MASRWNGGNWLWHRGEGAYEVTQRHGTVEYIEGTRASVVRPSINEIPSAKRVYRCIDNQDNPMQCTNITYQTACMYVYATRNNRDLGMILYSGNLSTWTTNSLTYCRRPSLHLYDLSAMSPIRVCDIHPNTASDGLGKSDEPR